MKIGMKGFHLHIQEAEAMQSSDMIHLTSVDSLMLKRMMEIGLLLLILAKEMVLQKYP